MLPSRLLRVVLTLTTLAVVWLVTSPARASEVTEQASFAASFSPTRALASAAPALPAPAPPITPLPPGSRAPLCDPRGAITFAPPPQMQDVEVSVDTTLTLDDCFESDSKGAQRAAASGRSPIPADVFSASTDAAVLTAAVTLAATARELLPAPAASSMSPRPGFRSTVDRPPRA